MNAITINVERWHAWAPGLGSSDESPEHWQGWAQGELDISCEALLPSVDFIPAMQRRRYSRLSKMAISVAHPCLDDLPSVQTVFCSQHGELARTAGLLEDLVAGELLSPTAFSMSVHNTASGLSAITRSDTAASTALAASDDSFESGFLDAAARLQSGRCDRVLLVVAEERLPTLFEQYRQPQQCDYALALLLSVEPGGQALSLATGPGQSPLPQSPEHALQFLRWWMGGESSLSIAAGRLSWFWSKK